MPNAKPRTQKRVRVKEQCCVCEARFTEEWRNYRWCDHHRKLIAQIVYTATYPPKRRRAA